ncbi:MAG: hypothetical protein IPK91_01090 [Saprospiraceae bacterium]|nr:hypothetical protein [Saprospiraceae bacterium]
MKIYNLFLFILPFISGCDNNDCKFGPYQIPYALNFIILKNGITIDTMELNSLKISYFDNNQKKYLKEFRRGKNNGDYKAYDIGVIEVVDMGIISGDSKIKTFYVEYSNYKPDTIFADYNSLNQEQACNHKCFCYYPLELLLFNDQIPKIDTNIKVESVYLFEKN